jgi:Nucleotidyltransferase domain
VLSDEAIAAAKAIGLERYPRAVATFLAGSLVRGEGTAASDLDLVVVFERVANAYRESFRFGRWPVEAFVHDPETLEYFFHEFDGPSGVPVLPMMISEGIEIPESSARSRALKDAASRLIAGGPKPWGKTEIEASRYAITNLVDDLRDPRSKAERTATGAALYAALSNHYLRSRVLWSARDKTIPRRLREADPAFAARFEAAFEALLGNGAADDAITLAEQVLAPQGGWLFDGYALAAPADWRRPR